jgi:epoxyqueuosine reductase
MRNALIAAGNSADISLVPAVERLLEDPSPLVRAMAVWALQRLVPAAVWKGARAQHISYETDVAVRAEWGAEAG